MAIAPVNTNERRANVTAFQVFRAIRVKASGTNTAVLNFKPNRNGKITFLTIFEERPIHKAIKIIFCNLKL